MPLTTDQRIAVTNLYRAVEAQLRLKYGSTVILEYSKTVRNQTGEVIGLLVGIGFAGPADVDGQTQWVRKEIPVW